MENVFRRCERRDERARIRKQTSGVLFIELSNGIPVEPVSHMPFRVNSASLEKTHQMPGFVYQNEVEPKILGFHTFGGLSLPKVPLVPGKKRG